MKWASQRTPKLRTWPDLEEKISVLFEKMDINRNGTLELSEFFAFYDTYMKVIESRVNPIERRGSRASLLGDAAYHGRSHRNLMIGEDIVEGTRVHASRLLTCGSLTVREGDTGKVVRSNVDGRVTVQWFLDGFKRMSTAHICDLRARVVAPAPAKRKSIVLLKTELTAAVLNDVVTRSVIMGRPTGQSGEIIDVIE